MMLNTLVANRMLMILTAVATCCFLTMTAWAGDFASRNIIGFSADGSRFAFEEYGTQDGSGFPYSNVYIIDTASDQWVTGTPVRVVLEDEQASEAEARAEALDGAKMLLLEIDQPGTLNATNQSLEIVDNPYRMIARPRMWVPPTSERIEFRIETLPFLGQDYCADLGETVGFRLTQVYNEPGKATRLLHEDSKVPDSRGCPLDYRFADIITYFPEGAPPVVTILILMETVGFEGPDGRYLAVTSPLE